MQEGCHSRMEICGDHTVYYKLNLLDFQCFTVKLLWQQRQTPELSFWIKLFLLNFVVCSIVTWPHWLYRAFLQQYTPCLVKHNRSVALYTILLQPINVYWCFKHYSDDYNWATCSVCQVFSYVHQNVWGLYSGTFSGCWWLDVFGGTCHNSTQHGS